MPASSSPDPATLPYRPCVGICLLSADDKVFVGRRIDTMVEAWQMPQGGIDPGEAPEDAALRELEEEVGTRNCRIMARTQEWLTYDLPAHLVGKVWKGRYRGQRQLWFAARFEGQDSEINLQTADPEFEAWKWVPMDALPDLIVPFKRDIYRQIVAEFRPLLTAARG
ncbi:RNA pyrophosphohydrolase [Marinibaculum pumilum]|uniref:RNA pyrophosphohydrolase n=1 Tax=Marinibaculum pumilum TaxID=1766165 RepID=A0ABV7L1Y9_9PROT